MKKNLLTLFAFLFIYAAHSQVAVDTTGIIGDSYNKWSIELSVGQGKGVKPYADGYFSSNPDKVFGGLQLNSFGIGARYMISPKFGLKFDFNYENFKNQSGSESLEFEMVQYRTGIQGVVNAVRLFGIEEAAGRFGLLLHGGLNFAYMQPQTEAPGHNKGRHEWNGGLIVGFSPQFRLTNSLALFADLSTMNNYRQHFNWDGSYAESTNNLSGQQILMSFGLSYSFGREKIHGDWAIIQDKKDKEIAELNNRIGEIETLMNDSDKDGVPDYLDVENNSIAGVAVDTKGRMVDKNTNGVPDELEKYIDSSITNNNSSNNTALSKNILEQLINEGYIAVYFDKNYSQPTPASADNIGFVLNYLRNNPSASVEISGYADEVGKSANNKKLASARAENVKAILVKAGINPSRLNAKGAGIDSSVDKNSEYARRLVRKAVFKITN
ncbi:OmpA family protein [Flavobacterium sp. J49]|uniref:OmpA family protein n=1 Tax=Flavobacterium sp. J49 TaxID=2718534 RepID=UPI001593EE11|nr:OmpA family protein [Flavobacterium sp. J49]MBF6640768.1 OmpA family protein [Flavobacterium sp. J49]NIC02015.1 OmpA family protein [Flavobacterium sp. J49]